ncbi:hypothetical protein KHC23_18480 [Ancylobacter dichloromethanicus]|uniref:Uncharacterized protein n=1 Tax=Ancylobacter dichloromethanicus TaxID=518825 RepID=A0A9W6MYD5_9HYPH|nr:hypothetical protein [Ancylobacter dichloromethanicus]MBS7555624.1 hypothetical protein [Ancylobacter dichloromethanicus]GLK70827.1 hypothetical protein GCM10017643_09420 [Ancylobacter dichloromethanicus]
MTTTAFTYTPPLRLTLDGDTADIATLDEALAFAETHPLPEGDYEGMVRRLQGAHSAEQQTEAANAFRWWAQSNGLTD